MKYMPHHYQTILKKLLTRLRLNVDKIYDENGLRRLLSLNNSSKVVDYLCHEINCEYIIVELTKSNVSKAIKQIEFIAETLRTSNLLLKEIILYVESLGRERKKYKIRNSCLYEKRGRKLIPVIIKTMRGHKSIKIFTKESIQ